MRSKMRKFSKPLLEAVVAVVFVYAVTCLTSVAQESKIAAVKARLDEVASSHAKGDDAFMGSVLVASDNEILLDKGYGMADLGWAIPNAPDVKFWVGSLTKQFTAALVLILQQGGKLRIEIGLASICRIHRKAGRTSPYSNC